MKFNINVWRKSYDKIQSLGLKLKNSAVSHNGFAPKIAITKEERSILKREIRVLIAKNNAYLTQCGLGIPQPKWIYNYSDERTHESSPLFQYSHLL